MKSNQHLFLLAALAILSCGFLQAQVNLKINDQYIIKNTPNVGTAIVYDVEELRNECIMLYGANPNKTALPLKEGGNTMNPGAQSSILCMAILHSVKEAIDGRRYEFSPGCAEEQKTSANVRVIFGSDEADTPLVAGGETDFVLNVNSNQILTIKNNETPMGPTGEKVLLLVDASPDNKAQVLIDQDPNRGQCFIAIVNSKTGQTMAVLNPKSETARSFTVEEAVYVVPVLKPSPTTEDGEEILNYDIGDPVRNGKVRVEETGKN